MSFSFDSDLRLKYVENGKLLLDLEFDSTESAAEFLKTLAKCLVSNTDGNFDYHINNGGIGITLKKTGTQWRMSAGVTNHGAGNYSIAEFIEKSALLSLKKSMDEILKE